MFHVFFSADENYIKYLAPLINSIVNATKRERSFVDYFKHEESLGGGQ